MNLARLRANVLRLVGSDPLRLKPETPNLSETGHHDEGD
jgi:hypothetical protein